MMNQYSPAAPLYKNRDNVQAAQRPAYRVLIIEDDAHIARLIAVNLTRVGLESRLALNGGDGLDAFRDYPPHLVLLDLMMPVMDGFQVCEKLRAESEVPIVIMTARLEPIHQMRGFRLGADDFVLKPFDPQLLVARVIAHLRRVYRYNQGRVQRKEAAGDAQSTAAVPAQNGSASSGTPREQTRCDEVLAHMPTGWAGCGACSYMGPLHQFPRRFNGIDTTALTCPHCNTQGQIRFAVE
jgi:CheY-like chemotaxis protein